MEHALSLTSPDLVGALAWAVGEDIVRLRDEMGMDLRDVARKLQLQYEGQVGA